MSASSTSVRKNGLDRSRRRRGLPRSSLPTLLLALLIVGAAARATDDFQDCETRLASRPNDLEAADCFWRVAFQQSRYDEGEARLRALLRGDPWQGHPGLELNLARLLSYRLLPGPAPEAEALFRGALHTYAERGQTAEVILARLGLAYYLESLRRFDEAQAELDAAYEDVERIAGEDPEKLALWRIRQAVLLRKQGRHLDLAYSLMRQAEGMIFPEGSASLQDQWLVNMPLLSWELGRDRETLAYRERLLERALEANNVGLEAIARFTIAVAYEAVHKAGPKTRDEHRRLLELALDAALRAEMPSYEAQIRRMLGRRLGGEAGRRQVEACLEIARRQGDRRLEGRCLGVLARLSLDDDPQAARELVYQAMDLAIAAGAEEDPRLLLYGWPDRLTVLWATLPPSQALAQSLEILDVVEEMRELQGPEQGRAGFLAVWSDIYDWLAGRLLLEASAQPHPEPEKLAAAFHIMERRRSRVLLEALESTGSAAPSTELAAVLRDKVQVQRQLLRPREAGQAAALWAELEALERREAELRRRTEAASGTVLVSHAAALASLDEVVARLDEDEALLAFQLGHWEDYAGTFLGGSWLWVLTRDGTWVRRLNGGRFDTEAKVAAVVQLGGDVEPAWAALWAELLGTALDELPATVNRLVILPDGYLHLLPFALLRPAPGAPTLAERYEISVAPSATLLLRWRDLAPAASTARALALADPTFVGGSPQGGERRLTLDRLGDLRPLPHARQEGEDLIRRLGGELWLGESATEHQLKTVDLQRYAILHFATHAVVFDDNPSRSAVLLAPGSDAEDGWLQPHEIAALDLAGRVVVLASCESAGGEIVRGEGSASLARAFFQAGARAVVASPWALRDAATAELFAAFYDRLSRGESVAAALAGARRERLQAGAPAHDWAGPVVWGDGAFAPFPRRVGQLGGWPAPAGLTLAGLMVVGLMVAGLAAGLKGWRLRRRSR